MEFWRNGLIIFAVGGEIIMTDVKQFVDNVWNTIAFYELYYHDEGYLLIL